MLLTKYLPHCHLFLTHDYYRDGWSRDFRIEPSAATRKSWQQLGYLLRPTEHGVSVYYSTDGSATDPLRSVQRPTKWQFGLLPEQPNFFFYTDLDLTLDVPIGRPILYLSNYDPVAGTSDNDIDSNHNTLLTQQAVATQDDAIGLVGTGFALPYDNGQHQTLEIWRLWPDQAAERIHQVTDLGSSASEVRISLPAGVQGLHEIRWSGSSNRQRLVYIDDQLANSNTVGVIELFRTPPVDYSQPINYYLEFVRRTATWRYYVINNQPGSIVGTDLFIDYNGSGGGPYPPAVTFARIAAADQTDAEQRTATTISNQEVILFRSQSPLPYYEAPLGGLQLRLTEGLNQRTLIADLPNPSTQQAIPNLFIHL